MKERLLTPGPVPVTGEALLAQARPVPFHRSEQVWSQYAAINSGLRRFLGHPQGELFLLGSSGSGAMEAAVCNLFSPGERVLIVCNGFFSGRFVEMASAFGLEVERLELPWDRAADPDQIANRLRADPSIRGVIVTFHDTATGVANDLGAIGAALAPFDALFVVDGVSGVAAAPVEMQDWGVDCVAGASQKALAAPPGLAFVALSPRAWKRCLATSNARFYFDLRKLKAAYDAGLTPSPWTPPVSTVGALEASIEVLLRDGLDAHYARQHELAEAVRQAVTALGLGLYADPVNRSDAVTVINGPPGIAPGEIVAGLRQAWSLTIAGGLGPLQPDTFRIGHVGAVDLLDIVGALFALEVTLARLGVPVAAGATGRAIHDVLGRPADSGGTPVSTAGSPLLVSS